MSMNSLSFIWADYAKDLFGEMNLHWNIIERALFLCFDGIEFGGTEASRMAIYS